MTAFVTFLRKEVLEVLRTWRMWVLPGMMLFIALTSPIIAKSTPAMLESMTSSQPGVRIEIPDPTYLDSYGQWIKNLQQMVLIALLLTSAGLIANERSSGTAILVLTKPLSRASMVIAKFIVQVALLAAATAVGTALCWVTTYLVFGEGPAGRLVSASAVWLGFAIVLTALMVALSARVNALAAGGLGILGFFVVSVLTLWGPAVRYSPVGLFAAPSDLLAGSTVALAWPLATAVALVIALLGLGMVLFERAEL